MPSLLILFTFVNRVVKVLEREVPSVTVRFCETTFKESQSQLSDVSLVVVVSSVSTGAVKIDEEIYLTFHFPPLPLQVFLV